MENDPIQPLWVLNSAEYYKKTSKVPAIAHFYKFHGASGISTSYAVPDGAIDIIIECGADRVKAKVCGSVNHGSLPGFEENKTYFGIRLHPESLDHIGDASIADLTGHEYNLDDIIHNRGLLEELNEEPDFGRQTAVFEREFLKSTSGVPLQDAAHKLTESIIARIYQSHGQIRVGELEAELHYSRRHLTRCFTETMGMDIKTFSNYVRFQYVLRGITDGRFTKASDAAMAGNYYDQSHFQKDFRNFTNSTPRSMIRLFQESDYTHRIILLG